VTALPGSTVWIISRQFGPTHTAFPSLMTYAENTLHYGRQTANGVAEKMVIGKKSECGYLVKYFLNSYKKKMTGGKTRPLEQLIRYESRHAYS